MEILVGIILALIGLAICFFGLRFWFILLPVFGAITGFFVGARVMQDIFGTGFLATASSWIVGIIVAVVFALLSYFVWYAGAIIMAGAVGASLFSGILHALFTNPWGVVLFIVALIGALVFAVGALMLNLPIYIVIVNSALAGASLAVAGLLTIFGTIEVLELANGATLAVVNETKLGSASWLWVLAWIVLAAAGVYYQLRSVNEIRLPAERWVPARAA
ncbi:MAG TPA: DUF4203 domain-containing protein [Thermomicrobiales bacterium]|nr:DUF4203 domain-containing protein [Thermomicrobiales bacterium]